MRTHRSEELWMGLLGMVLLGSATGCTPSLGEGNGNGQGNDNVTVERPPSIVLDEPVSISGRVMLPTGSTVVPTTLRVSTSNSDAAPDADGGFDVEVLWRTPSFMQVTDPSGRLVLMGFVNPDSTEPAVVDARSTAVALLYFANAGWMFFPDSLQNVLDVLGPSQAVTDLAAAIESALAANPAALHDGDPAVLAALDAAHEATKFPDPPRDSTTEEGQDPTSKTGPRLQGSQISPLLLITPDASTRQSGVQIAHDPNGEGIVAMNNFRRRGMMFVYRTGTETDGTMRDLTPPEVVDELEIPTTHRLSLISSLNAVLQGSASWAPVTTSAVELTHDSAVDKTFYEAVVIGSSFDFVGTPAVVSDPKFANFVGLWNATADTLQWKLVLFDFFVPVVETIAVGGALSALESAQAATLSAFIATLNPVLLEQGITIPRTNAQAAAFLQAAVREMADDAIFSTRVLSHLQGFWPAALGTQATLTTIQTRVAAAATSATFLRAIQLAMTALDAAAVIRDNQSSSWADGWEIIAAPRNVHVNPTSTRVEIGDTRSFTAMLSSPPNGVLIYEWSTSGNYGHLGDGVTEGVMVESRFTTMVYSSNPNARDGDRDTITVRVFLETSDGGRVLVGELEEPVEVIAEQDPVCDELDVASYQSGCGSIALSSMDIRAGEFMTVNVTVNCGPATFYCDYVASGTMEVDGSSSPGDGGVPQLYGYDPPTPVARLNGAGVLLQSGGHSVRFQIPLSAPNDCINIDTPFFGRDMAVGPWCFLGGGSPNTWSSVAHFRVRQSGL